MPVILNTRMIEMFLSAIWCPDFDLSRCTHTVAGINILSKVRLVGGSPDGVPSEVDLVLAQHLRGDGDCHDWYHPLQTVFPQKIKQ
ncbi:2984_t:CDS:2 [Acaulospora colombiana]|uniref:2984_t:CDS:1 n=1 Tax=Acaulospora colombiana TaxID=27376 RepID=A0ACA9PQL5_9GLOM|nr:2984_t:CDS:2 [Acaulospora colombiana]